jgi:hypothetical protein
MAHNRDDRRTKGNLLSVHGYKKGCGTHENRCLSPISPISRTAAAITTTIRTALVLGDHTAGVCR